ncbi:MAG: hypothetical protein ABH875_02245 [Candidatus Omnitrophota bacterium]
MNSKERISKILNFQIPDRIGIHDQFLDTTVENWKADGFPDDTRPENYFDLDIDIVKLEDALVDNLLPDREDRFRVLSFSEPFQRLCNVFGREEILRRLARYPKELKASLINETYSLLGSIKKVLESGAPFDGAWAWGDMAYSKGLFFSPSWYKEELFPIHKKIFRSLSSKGLFVFFHSEGNIVDIMPSLVDAGVRALHPLEEEGGMDIAGLMKEYRKDMVFIGHLNIAKMIRQNNFIDILRYSVGLLKDNCSYIYSASYPIMPEISFGNYKMAIEALRSAGAY